MQLVMTENRRVPTTAILLMVLVFMSGCGSAKEPERASIKGTVTLDGQPVDGGYITFQNSTVASGGTIKNGEFNQTGNEGLLLGDYTVRFNWMKPTGKKVLEPDSGQETDELAEVIPAKHNSQSTEKATIKSGENLFKFVLTSK